MGVVLEADHGRGGHMTIGSCLLEIILFGIFLWFFWPIVIMIGPWWIPLLIFAALIQQADNN